MPEVAQKKRHHFVPEAYLKAFCNEVGKLVMYRKDSPLNPIELNPTNAAVINYYYSQPLPNGDRDNNRLEEFFGLLESNWPNLVERIAKRQNINDSTEEILHFVSAQRVRVPASRDIPEIWEYRNH